MLSQSLNRGDIIEHDNQRYRVWEISGDYYGLLPSLEQDDAAEQSPIYVPKSSRYRLIRRRNVDPLHSIPPNAQFLLETCPTTEYDLTTMRLWTDGNQGNVELHHIRLTGVLGLSDGSLTQTGHVNHEDIEEIQNELGNIGYWEMDVKPEQPKSSSWWLLRATDGIRTHSVERYGDTNEIRGVCERCCNLVDKNNLETGPFNVA